ncbi:MAG: GAF domain-containing protein [Actinomycetales bacterium]|jgi:GAF domain-containing protein|nr:GAF domain-containing protein [Actinomycetales bacterium]
MAADLGAILREAAAQIGHATSCSVIVRVRDGLTRLASSDARAAACDDAEVQDRRGPCVLAMDQLSGVLVPDVATEDRWAAWTAAAREAGFRSGAALPAYVADGVVAALNLYSDEPDPWDGDALVRADGYVQAVARAIRERGL